MAEKTSNAHILDKHRAVIDRGVKLAADKPTTYGITELPPGIHNGVAQLKTCEIGEYSPKTKQPGQPYVMMMGVIMEPESVFFDGQEVNVKSLQTRQIFPLGWTKNSKNETTDAETNISRTLNEFRKLGYDTAGADDTDAVIAAVEWLEENQPFFRFSTTPRYDQVVKDKVTGSWERWNGNRGLENYTPPEPNDVEDNTAESKPAAVNRVAGHGKAGANGKPADAGSPAPAKAARGKAAKVPEPEPEPDEVQYSDQEDLDELAKRADKGDGDAQDRIGEIAREAGVFDEADQARTWTMAVGIIKKAGAAGTEGDEGNTPKKGEVWMYADTDPKNPKKRVKAVEAEVTMVNARQGTCHLRCVGNPKQTWLDIPFDELEAVD
jgi:hypothetical protein